MKKFLFIIFLIFPTLILGCSNAKTETQHNPSLSSVYGSSSPNFETNNTLPENTENIPEVDNSFLTVEVILPDLLFINQDMSTFDPNAYAEENDMISARVLENGSVCVVMTKSRHEEVLGNIIKSNLELVEQYTNGEETPYIKEIVFNNDLSSFTMKVDRIEYEQSMCVAHINIAINASFYQSISGAYKEVEFTIIDLETNDVILSITY